MSNFDRENETEEQTKEREAKARLDAEELLKQQNQQQEQQAKAEQGRKSRLAANQAANPPSQYQVPVAQNPPSNAMEQNQQKSLAEEQMRGFFAALDANKNLSDEQRKQIKKDTSIDPVKGCLVFKSMDAIAHYLDQNPHAAVQVTGKTQADARQAILDFNKIGKLANLTSIEFTDEKGKVQVLQGDALNSFKNSVLKSAQERRPPKPTDLPNQK